MVITPLPPHCPTHRGRRSYTPGCVDCQRHARLQARRRSRAIAYGTWQGMLDAEPTRAHIADLIQSGMSISGIATRAQVDRLTVKELHLGVRSRIHPRTAAQIQAVAHEPIPYHLVDATGGSRRLQALACAGYTARDLVRLQRWELSEQLLYRWRAHRHPYLHRDSHLLIVDVYNQLWDTDGPNRQYAARAVARGWQPFEAWTDQTIDNPDAGPYAAPEAVEFIDWVKLNYARLEPGNRRRVPFLDLTWAEQRELYRRHVGAGGSPRGFRDRYRPVPIEILRKLEAEWGPPR